MDNLPETDLSLIAQLRDPENHAAWESFLRLYEPVVFRLARRKGLQDADAQDVCQRVTVSLMHAISGWQPIPGKPFRMWLGTIARNAICNALTRRPRDVGSGSSGVEELLYQVVEQTEESDAFRLELRRSFFRQAMEVVRPEFAPATWELFWETEIANRSPSDVASAFGKSVGSVYVARCRVIKRLREYVQSTSHEWGLDMSHWTGQGGRA